MSLCLFLSAGCRQAVDVGPPVEPETAPAEIGSRLRRLAGFAFRLEYHTDRPFELGASFSGVRDSSDRERWEGVWWRGGERRSYHVFGDGSVQYERAGSAWSRVPRGNESRFFDHLESVLRAAGLTGDGRRPALEFAGEAGGVYRYEFEPRMPLLDPTGQKRMRGELELDRRTGLLRRVICREVDGPARWELGLSRFNRVGPVVVPFVPAMELVLAPEGPGGRAGLDLAVRVAADRLRAAELRHRFLRRWGQLLLQLERDVPAGVLGLLLGPADVGLWAGDYAVPGETLGGPGHREAAPSARSVGVQVGGDAARLVVLTARLGGNGDFEVGTGLEFTQQPTLIFDTRDSDGSPALPDSGLVVLVLDGRPVDAAPARSGRVEFIDVGGRELVSALAVAATLPPTAGLRILRSRPLAP
ncbi:MAG: hypothetical protein R6X12_08405 [bacterium]